MLVNLKSILSIAESENFAVGAFNITSIPSLKAVVRAAEELNKPVILQFAQPHEIYHITLEDIGPLMVRYAEKVSVPICVHLDHGTDLDYLKKSLDLGFSSIMFDGSGLDYELNAEISSKAVELAADYSAGVEAELGTMGKRIANENEAVSENAKIYTDPELAAEFVSSTGIDALACSFGTTHGVYLTKPKLNFEIVRSVREKTGNIPVVMHGGSGVSEEDYYKSIEAGVRKINYFTYMEKAAGLALKEKLLSLQEKSPMYVEQVGLVEDAMYSNVKSAMTVFANRK